MPALQAPSVTICIFTHNRKHYLRLAIQAALAQSYQDFELLIMDNASTDGTTEMIAEFQDPRIRHHRNPLDRGAAVSYRLAMRNALGRFILLTHDDDIMRPTLVERQVRAFTEDLSLVAVTTNVAIIDESGKLMKERRTEDREDRLFRTGEYIGIWMREHLWLPFPTLMLRRPLAVTKLFEPSYWYTVGCLADIYIMIRLNTRGAILFIADPLVDYRQHSQQAQFQHNQIGAPVQLCCRLRGLCRMPHLLKYQPLAMLLWLRYRVQQIVLLGRQESLDHHPRLSHKISNALKHYEKKMRQRRIGYTRYTAKEPGLKLALEKEREALPWVSQLQLCALVLGLNFKGLGYSSGSGSGPFGAWCRKLERSETLCAELPARGISRVAVLGTLLNAFLIAADARRSGVEVVCFMDSNKLRWRHPFCGRKVRTPRWLRRHEAEVDAVILSSEQNRDEALVQMLRTHLLDGSQLPIISWKSLAE